MDETSLTLLARAGEQGDGEAWNRLVGLYTPLLRNWLRAYEVQDADADDLVQDVLAVLARELPGFEHKERPGAFRSWLRKVLVHRLQNFWRGRKYRPAAPGGSSMLERLAELEDDRSDASRLWESRHDEELIGRLMEAIRADFLPKTWEAFRRQMFDGQSAAEVAAAMEMPIASVYAARSRVLAALRREAGGLVDGIS